MKQKFKRVIFLANPFGYGPSSKAITIIDKLRAKWEGEVIYAASNKCLETLSPQLAKKIKVEKINDRDPYEIAGVLNRYRCSLVVVVLNKVAVETVAKNNLHCFFVDPLTYLWQNVPESYLKANRYYYFDIFDAQEKVKTIEHSFPLSPIFGQMDSSFNVKKEKSLVLFHVGGFSNPLVEGINEFYLNILAKVVNEIKEKKVVVAGGKSAIDYLKGRTKHSVQLGSYGHDRFLEILSKCEHFLTTAGMAATFEAFNLRVPVFFLPSNNLSQWKQSNFFNEKAKVPKLEWNLILNRKISLDGLTEKEGIKKIRQLSKIADQSEVTVKKVVDKVKTFVNNNHRLTYQNKYLEKVGTQGTDKLVKDILKKLS